MMISTEYVKPGRGVILNGQGFHVVEVYPDGVKLDNGQVVKVSDAAWSKLDYCQHDDNTITQDSETCNVCGYTYRLHADATGKDIEVGMKVLAPFASGGKGGGAQIVRGLVMKIGKPYHVGYGYMQCKLTLYVADTGKTMTHPLPANCIIVEG